LELFQIATDTSAGRDKVLADIAGGIREVRDGHAGDRMLGIGIGVPGLIRLEEGVIAKAPNLPGWEDFPLRDELERELQCPVVLENDANAAALGEVWMGAGHDVEDLVLLTLGTGIGGGIISQGRILHGYLGMAGELGHITVEPHSGIRCGCGNFGCVEVHASATAIARMGEEAVSLGSSRALAALKEEHGALDALLVERAAREGDPEAIKIYERMGCWLGRALANLINIFNFPLYLLAGGVVGGWKLFAPAMFQEIEQRSLTYRESDTRVKKAKLGNKAGLFGAAHLPMLQPRPR
jgi:glucokinase